MADKQWPADKVERRPVADLVPYARNARTHSPEQVDQIAASIREWGWTTPVLVDESNEIIAGHGRILAAHKLKLATVPVMTAIGWTEAQKRAYVLADNKLALNAGWDMDLLKTELLDLDHLNFDLGLVGFNQDELANIFAPVFTDEDVARAEETPEPPVNPVTVLGDVWILGNHRIVCGDRKQSTLWQIDKPQKSETGHSTQKPVECMKRPIENNSSPGQAVYEPFSGSGTTIMAGELTGRHIHAIELSPAYVDVAIKRWQHFTGKKATHAETGKTFDEMSDARYEGGEWAKNTSGSYDDGIKAIRKKKQKAEAAE